ncbi:MAG: dihydroorotase [Candidatus Obscuribacterales bacterium]|nr:dihydroorotase [Candidatus Obscuribacterales bacterium]
MTGSLLLRNGLIIDPDPGTDNEINIGTARKCNGNPRHGLVKRDIRIKDGIITEIAPTIEPGEDEQIYEAEGLFVSPGFIDLHTHLRDFDQSAKEDFRTGSQAAAAGGFTTVLTMANTIPTTDSLTMVENAFNRIAEKAVIRVLPIACVTKDMQGEQLTEMARLADMGVPAFSDDGLPVSNLAVLRHALEYSNLSGKPIISHPEDMHLSQGGCINESLVSTRLGLPGIPGMSESACIAREIEIVRGTGCHLHFAHVSTASSVKLIADAKAAGLKVTAEAAPHHLVLCDEDITEYDTRYKMNPPLRSACDRDAVVAALIDGTIDTVATDHAPHTSEEKSRPFEAAPFGIIGLETAFSLVFELLFKKHDLPLSFVSHRLSTAAARVIGFSDPAIRIGGKADIAIIDPDRRWVYSTKDSFSKSSNSPFDGRELSGKVVSTIYQGNIVYRDSSSTVTN